MSEFIREPWSLSLHTCESISEISDGDDWTFNGAEGQPLLFEEESPAKTAQAIYLACEEITTLRQQLGDLLAIIHKDGGHHTEAVGITQSIADAKAGYYLLREQSEQLAQYKADAELANKVIDASRCIRHWHDIEPDGMVVSAEHVRSLWLALHNFDSATGKEAK